MLLKGFCSWESWLIPLAALSFSLTSKLLIRLYTNKHKLIKNWSIIQRMAHNVKESISLKSKTLGKARIQQLNSFSLWSEWNCGLHCKATTSQLRSTRFLELGTGPTSNNYLRS
jgi:hypothetical protein